MADLFIVCEENSASVGQDRKLTDSEKEDLLAELEKRPCLWKSGGNWLRKDKTSSQYELCKKFNMTVDGLKKVIHSLRTSMAREIKRAQDNPDFVSTWRFFKSMSFLEEEIRSSLQQEVEWRDDESTTVIEFYKENPILWNHCLPEYRDRNKKKLAFEKLKGQLKTRSEDQIKNHWHSLKTVFDREDKRQRGSKKSGTSSAEVYKSNWRFFDIMVFTKDCSAVDESTSTMSVDSGNVEEDEPVSKKKKKEKGKMSPKEIESMRVTLYQNAMEALKCNDQKFPSQPVLEEEAFGRTVAETLSRFTSRQRAIAKKRISDILYEIEMGFENNPTSPFMFPAFSPPSFCTLPDYQQANCMAKQTPATSSHYTV